MNDDMGSAWDYDRSDSRAVRYWKLQVRHWQTLAAISWMGGMILGAMLTLWMAKVFGAMP